MANGSHDSITLGTANIATGTVVATGMLGWLNENAGAISVLIGFTSAIIALVFYVLNYRLKLKAHDLYRDEVMNEILDQIRSEAGEDAAPLVDKLAMIKERRGSQKG